MIGTTISHYRILERLGEGGMGVVYKAEDTKLGRTVALKFLPSGMTRDEEARKRFMHEARAAALLDHPNICTVYEVDEDESGRMFIAMAHYDGATLREKLAEGRLPIDKALRIAQQVAGGLAKAHASGIIHRDIKPSNVALTSDGAVKILDFGVAKLLRATRITESRTTIGTVAYMPPEQLLGETVEAPADLWSMGVTLFELLTGELPFRGEGTQALSYAILNEQPRSVTGLNPDVTPELERVVKRMLRKDPVQRYQSAEEVLEELEPLVSPSSGSGGAAHRGRVEREVLKPGARLGPYEIVRPLGAGGMGDVYLGHDTRLDREVAVKVLPPEFSQDLERRERFRREAKAISSLSHPNVCTVFDVGEQEGVDFIVMERLEGETLADRLGRGALPVPKVLDIGAQIATGLGQAHRQGIVHRDLKPANVMLLESGGVKLLDFGLAKGIDSAFRGRGSGSGASEQTAVKLNPLSKGKPLTAEGMIVGTLPYMAPEQVEGKEADERSDIFALGAMLYEMVTGRHAFEGKSSAGLIAAILSSEPASMSSLESRTPSALEHVVRRCMEKEPDHRWQSAFDLASELQWISEAGTHAGVATTITVKWKTREKIAWIAGILLAVMVAFLGGALYRGSEETPATVDAQPTIMPKIAFEVTPPEGHFISRPRLTPDGLRLLYRDIGEDDVPRLVSRELGSTRARVIGGTDHLWYRWGAVSPDGRSFAFVRVGRLYKIALDGGAPVKLSDYRMSPAGFMDWGQDGRIYLSPQIFSEATIHAIPESGGELVPVTTLASGVDRMHSHVFVLPNGKILFQVSTKEGTGNRDLEGIYIAAPGAGEKTLVMKSPGLWRYAGGFIVQKDPENGARLLFHRFDQDAGKTVGEPLPVDFPIEVGDLSVSNSGVIAIQEPEQDVESELVWFDRSGNRLETVGERGSFSEPIISPDMGHLAVLVESDDPAESGLWVYDLARGSRNRVAEGNLLRGPQWSPDGLDLYYLQLSKGILRIRRDGVDEPETLAEGDSLWPNDVAANGDVLYWEQRSEKAYLKLLPIGGGEIRTVVDGDVDYAVLSPDGSMIAYMDLSSAPVQVYVQRTDGTGLRVQVSKTGGVLPKWPRDGNELFYFGSSRKRELMAVKIRLDGETIDVGEPRILFKTRTSQTNHIYDVSPDGQRILVAVPVAHRAGRPITVFLNWVPELFGGLR